MMIGRWSLIASGVAALILLIQIYSLQPNSKLLSLVNGTTARCLDTKKVNTSKYAWNAYDETVLNLAKVRCSFKYRNSPCVTRFEKYDVKDYNVTCGAAR